MKTIPYQDGLCSFSDHGKGKPLLWMHGMLMNAHADNLLGVIRFDELEETCRIIRCEAPAHGESTATTCSEIFQWSKLPEVFNAIATKLNLERLIVGGFSMGSAAAINFALKYPQKVKALILAMPPVIWDDRRQQCDAYKRMARLAKDNRLQRTLPQLSGHTVPSFIEKAYPGTRKAIIEQMSMLDTNQYEPVLQGAAASDYPAPDEIKKINVPVVILGWEEDPTHPIESIRKLKDVLPHAHVSIASNIAEMKQFTPQVIRFTELL